MRLRRLLLASFLLPAMLVPGCKCIRTVSSVRQEDAMQKKISEDLAKRDAPEPAPSASASAASSVFDVEKRLEELRENFANQRWESVRHDATALLTASLDEVTKLEVVAMLLESLRNSGERARASEIQEQFDKLYKDLKDSEKLAKDAKTRERVTALVNRVKVAIGTDRYAAADGEPRLSFTLGEKIRSAGEEEVLEMAMPDGGTVYYSKSGTALEAKCNAVSRELGSAIQREPEHGYYFAIAEAPPPKNATSGAAPR